MNALVMAMIPRALTEIPEIRRNNSRHKLIDLLVVAFLAILSGADDWVAVVQYGRRKQIWLKTFLELPHGLEVLVQRVQPGRAGRRPPHRASFGGPDSRVRDQWPARRQPRSPWPRLRQWPTDLLADLGKVPAWAALYTFGQCQGGACHSSKERRPRRAGPRNWTARGRQPEAEVAHRFC